MEQPPSGGTIASRVCPSPATTESDDGGEDRIGALPDGLLLLVLGALGSTEEAARTSILSRRWRPVWIELPALAFRGVGPDKLLDLLAMARPQLSRLEIRVPRKHEGGISTAQVSALLRAAEEHQPEELVLNVAGGDDDDLPFELPCFARATSINLQVWNRSFTLPASGDFSKLERLTLSLCCDDPGEFLSRCPLLRVLDVCFFWTRDKVDVHSMSLQELILKDVGTRYGDKALQLVDIVAPALKKFRMQSCGNRDLIMAFSEKTVVESASYRYFSKLSRPVGIGSDWRLLGLTMETERRSRSGGMNRRVHVLSLMIVADDTPHYTDAKRSFVEEIARLGISSDDDISVLKLDFQSDKQLDFGNVVFHVLEYLDVIRSLHLVLRPEQVRGELGQQGYAQLAQNIHLGNLEEVEIEGMTITGYHRDFVEALFISAPLLKVLRIQLFDECPRSCLGYRELCRMFWENDSVKCYVNGILEDSEENLPPIPSIDEILTMLTQSIL